MSSLYKHMWVHMLFNILCMLLAKELVNRNVSALWEDRYHTFSSYCPHTHTVCALMIWSHLKVLGIQYQPQGKGGFVKMRQEEVWVCVCVLIINAIMIWSKAKTNSFSASHSLTSPAGVSMLRKWNECASCFLTNLCYQSAIINYWEFHGS